MKIVYIDAQNIHKSTQDVWWNIDRWSFFLYLQRKFLTDEIKIFFGYIPKHQTLYDHLTNIWYKIVFKETLTLPNGDIKWNVDIDIAIEYLLDLCEWWLKQAYLVTGDGD